LDSPPRVAECDTWAARTRSRTTADTILSFGIITFLRAAWLRVMDMVAGYPTWGRHAIMEKAAIAGGQLPEARVAQRVAGGVEGLEDHPHAASTNLTEDLIMANEIAR
jgi:hypothetical protein